MPIAKRFFQPAAAVAFRTLLQELQRHGIEYRTHAALSQAHNNTLIGDIAGLGDKAGDKSNILRLVYMNSVKHKKLLESTQAIGFALVPQALPQAEQEALWVAVRHPEYVFALLSRMLYPQFDGGGKSDIVIGDKPIADSAMIGKAASIGTSVIIGENVSIGDNVRIAPHSVIGDGCVIGDNVNIGAHCMLRCCTIGAHSRIASGTIIGECGFGVAWAKDKPPMVLPHIGGVVIGARVDFGANVTIDRGKFGDTIIGDDVKLDNMVHIAHNVVIGAATVIAGQSGVAGSAIIGKRVMIGGAVAVSDGVKVGDGAIIAGAAGVANDVAAGMTVIGTPAQPFAEFARSWAKFKQLGKRLKDHE